MKYTLLLGSFIIIIASTLFGLQNNIKSVMGLVEINKKSEWEIIDTTFSLNNNDKIRTDKNSGLFLSIKKHAHIYIGPESVLKLDYTYSDSNKYNLINFILYKGSMFFSLKNDSLTSNHIFSINSKSSSVKIQKPSAFFFHVNSITYASKIQIIRGTVNIKSIQNKFYKTISAAKTAEIKYKDIQNPKFFKIQKLDGVESNWLLKLDSTIIENEKKLEQKRISKIKAILANKAIDNIFIGRFKNSSDFKGKWHLEEKLAKTIYSILKNKYDINIEYIGTKDFSGKKKSLILNGTITDFSFTKTAHTGSSQSNVYSYLICSLTLKVSINDLFDSRKICEFTLSEEIIDQESEENNFHKIRERPFDLKDEIFNNSVAGKCVNKIIKKFINNIDDCLYI